ncbi:tripeptidyl peptidase [Melampsora larici-populina 98AG31]|uniref:tripeptidyl-peptidase II n=1 Tax=Melampsora larici-populina (strain 98AG31 / pathotype 3-4-7) TaxID=747676 RepID=F4S2D0_MELLP|nr:tripeptidyl peptidase [Melampsora larici-populina 98AG31]EGG01224.1 tripeptidyl peptidase [Melampsora larici-populina 98AG31]
MRDWVGTLSLLLVLTCLSTARAVHSSREFYWHQRQVLFETHRAPSTFTKLSARPPQDHKIDLRFALKTRLEGAIDELLGRISDPSHSSYLDYLTDDQSNKLSKPDDDAIATVSDWLRSHEIQRHRIQWSKMKDWVTVTDVPLPQVEYMLDTSYSIFQHLDGDQIIRTESFSLPHNLHRHIDVVQPTTMFGRLKKQRSRVRVAEELSQDESSLLNTTMTKNCTNPDVVTNDCLRKLYQTFDYEPKAIQMGNRIGITGFLGEAANFNDTQRFLALQRPDQKGHTFEVVSVNGGENPQTLSPDQISRKTGIEANLDTQTVLGFTSPTPNVFWTVGGSPPFQPDRTSSVNTNEPYLAWLEYILSLNNSEIPRVISTSYGDDEQTVPLSYARKVCHGFAQLGARGVSVIFSSGDDGVGKDGRCVTNDGLERKAFTPIFPASCPYVTSVGATENFEPEVAVSKEGPGGFSSGGGFSNYFPRPKWQKSVVKNYFLSLGSTHSGLYNVTGRGYPDVSAQGAKYVIAWQGRFVRVGGTSASAPTFASVISLLNDYSLSRGGRSLGYLNPWLYSVGFRGLNDITSGSSSGCDTKGFAAREGWDPVTGLGTPNFKKLQTLVKVSHTSFDLGVSIDDENLVQ